VVTKSLFDWPQSKPEVQPQQNGMPVDGMQPEVLRGWGERIALKSDRKIVLLRTAEIEWIEAAGNYVNIHARHSTHFVRETMHSIEQKMPPDRFMRIHRSTIVNLDRVKELKAGANGEYMVLMQDGQALTLSRGYRGQLEKLMR
jgi:two-component system LytT family response regulator